MKRVVNIAESKEWYETEEQAQAYLNLMQETYGVQMAGSENRLLTRNLDAICDSCPDKTSYVDLGPGDGRKTLILCTALSRQGKLKSHTAVDVQPRFLEVADEIGRAFGIPTKKEHTSFEDFLRRPQPFPETPKFIYLGATFGNFEKDEIEKRLTAFMAPKDLVYLSTGLRPSDPQPLIESYIPSVNIFVPVVNKKGLKGGELKIRFNEKTSSIEQVYETHDTVYVLGISKKHTEETFKEQISKHFDGTLFVEENYIGFLGKKK